MTKEIIIRNGPLFGEMSMVFSIVILPLTTLAFLELKLPIISIIPLILLALILFTFRGVQFKPNEKKWRFYNYFLGFRYGNWLSMDYFNLLSIIQSKKRGRIGGAITTAVAETSYNLIIMDKTHRNKRIIKNFLSFNNAKLFAD
jgi:hypothetical protein